MFGIGTQELIIIAVILFMLFGATRLPSLMRSLGRSVNEFKTGLREEPVDPKRLEDKEEVT
jgi:sec-independent protein translocase protein TatA